MSRKKAQKRFRKSGVVLCVLVVIVSTVEARADLSKKQARRVIQSVAGWSLPSDAVRVESIRSNGAESAEVSAELETVFRLRQFEGHWRLHEIRVGQDRWEQLEGIARAANAELPTGECDAPSEFARSKSDTELTNKRARCLVAHVFGIALPSDDVRIKSISPFALPLGSETPTLVTALVHADFRFSRDAKGWRVTEFKSGNRDWVNITGLATAVDQIKRTAASEDLSTIVKALIDFRRDRGYFVVSDKESVLIDHLSPHYLARVIRVDPWHRPYQYDGQQDRYSLRSLGPDGKPNTPDDIVVSGP